MNRDITKRTVQELIVFISLRLRKERRQEDWPLYSGRRRFHYIDAAEAR
jgi:hypothetical protein